MGLCGHEVVEGDGLRPAAARLHLHVALVVHALDAEGVVGVLIVAKVGLYAGPTLCSEVSGTSTLPAWPLLP